MILSWRPLSFVCTLRSSHSVIIMVEVTTPTWQTTVYTHECSGDAEPQAAAVAAADVINPYVEVSLFICSQNSFK